MSIIKLVENLKPLIKVRNITEKAIIDNKVFQLHYRTTSLILLVCCAFVTAYSIFGNAIECIGSDNNANRAVINAYCYIGNTYSLPWDKDNPNTRIINGLGEVEPQDKKQYHSYYRWVPLMLFLQGMFFYLPHWIWKNCENKKLNHLTDGLRGPVMIVNDIQKDKIKSLATYIADSFHTHNKFALAYYFCEILNFINVVLNMYTINTFLDGEFTQYGFDVLDYTDEFQLNRTDPMIKVFPRLTKCDFSLYGPTATLQTYDYLCILALNNLNEKIYIFLWFWLIILACLSISPIIYNIAVYLSATIRKRELNKHNILNGKNQIEKLAEKTQIGDFFLLDLMGKNMSSKCYREFIDELCRSLEINEKLLDSEEEITKENSKVKNKMIWFY